MVQQNDYIIHITRQICNIGVGFGKEEHLRLLVCHVQSMGEHLYQQIVSRHIENSKMIA
jgi:hypothetical protein